MPSTHDCAMIVFLIPARPIVSRSRFPLNSTQDEDEPPAAPAVVASQPVELEEGPGAVTGEDPTKIVNLSKKERKVSGFGCSYAHAVGVWECSFKSTY